MRRQQTTGLVVGLLAVFALVFAVVPASFARPDRLALVSVALYVAFSVRKRLGVGERPRAVVPLRHSDEVLVEEQDIRLARLDAALARAGESGEQFARVTRPMLRALATERLRAHAGIDVTADPAGARRQMGEDLWAMFSAGPDDVGPAPDPATLHDLVTALERL